LKYWFLTQILDLTLFLACNLETIRADPRVGETIEQSNLVLEHAALHLTSPQPSHGVVPLVHNAYPELPLAVLFIPAGITSFPHMMLLLSADIHLIKSTNIETNLCQRRIERAWASACDSPTEESPNSQRRG
jgi:hypothetical protein